MTAEESARESSGPAAETVAPARARYWEERREPIRQSIAVSGVVAMIAMPLWSLFDFLLMPDHAWTFTWYRLAATAVIAVSWALLFTPFGRRRPEICGLGVLAAVEIAIAAMFVHIEDSFAAYALGMSLAIYASGLVLFWHLRYTLILIGITFASLGIAWSFTENPIGPEEIAVVAFYLVTASALAAVAQILRDHAAWQVFQTRAALEEEQLRTRDLVERLDRLSHEDSLTGLANRRAWDEVLERECARVARAGGARTLSILLCDVDRLKEVNDSLGHATGDMVLRRIAELMEPRIRTADLVARIGGDEFAVLAIDTAESEAATLAEDIRERVESAQPGGPTVGATLSTGVAEWDGDDDSPETLMQRADRRLYAAKARRNVVCAGDPLEPV